MAPAANSPIPAVTKAATVMPMTQPRTVLNLVHSARRSCAKPSRPVCWPGRYGRNGARRHRATSSVLAPEGVAARNSTASLVSSM